MAAIITTAIGNVIDWFGSVINAILDQTNGDWKDIAVFVGISVACSLVFLGIKVVKKLIKGY